ncbi:Planctomycete cytochrome C [Caulifigura coniformis]|uniref:Planctomycete cytochrome C n=1 Tax=Caulifigura coniformis TaxID=2527983 RepID=A0A517SBH4_9PLAN|nr:c-type cytochrome domain-containing protein [Caulifigura coniformis]QDT53436.1 Planctomycete cytochrome C [Caulifigura coniformis]
MPAPRSLRPLGLAILTLALLAGVPVKGELTKENRAEIADVTRSLGPVSAHVRKKEFDEAEKLISAAEEKLAAIATAAAVKEDDRVFNPARIAIQKAKNTLSLARDKASGKKPEKPKPVSFALEVAPIVSARCLGCHGQNNPRANLRLDTFASWRRGGRSGPILAPGNPRGSLLIGRITTNNEQARMPQGEEALPADEINIIALWITQGARFDGHSETATLDEVSSNVALRNFDYPRPKGTETVSFTRDIAPFMANLCGGCHSAQRKSGGLSLVSYFDLMQGGESGEVIIPGDKDKSRLFRLVGGLENPRMPANQSRITRKNYDDLKKWFEEGNTFDGENPRTPLRTYVRSDEEMAREKFAKMTPEERKKMREDRTAELWKKALPKETMNKVEDAEFLVVGNVSPERLAEVQKWATSQLDSLRKGFRAGESPVWKGRLTIFVIKDRFGYDEFNLTNNNRQAPRELSGHSVVTANDEDAYLCLQDVGDSASATAPGLHVGVIDHLTGAFLKRGGASVPEWLARGMGLAMAFKEHPSNSYLQDLPSEAYTVAGSVPSPEDIFEDGSFSPATLPSVGFSLVEFLVNAGGPQRFAQFVGSVREGGSLADAAKAAYSTDLTTLARQYFATKKKR